MVHESSCRGSKSQGLSTVDLSQPRSASSAGILVVHFHDTVDLHFFRTLNRFFCFMPVDNLPLFAIQFVVDVFQIVDATGV